MLLIIAAIIGFFLGFSEESNPKERFKTGLTYAFGGVLVAILIGLSNIAIF